ncbi:MAG TPA: HepT-like ribonuclease domain-containing protein [Bryobacteraceae bacterium]
MPSKDPVQRFEDILENIGLTEEFTRGMDLKAFLEDLKTRNATERCMERISEAARKLGQVAEDLCPDVPWSNVRALRNFLRHEYDRIDAARVWVMIEDDLGPLKAAAQRALEELRRTEQ